MIPGPFGAKALGEEFVTCSLVAVVEKQSPSVPQCHLWSLLWWPDSVQGKAGPGAALAMGSTTPGPSTRLWPSLFQPPGDSESVTLQTSSGKAQGNQTQE